MATIYCPWNPNDRGVKYWNNFGQERTNPNTGNPYTHTGEDIAAPKGTPIPAAGDGEVVFSGWTDGYGNTVIIEHIGADGKTFYTFYGHLDNPGAPVGTNVYAGDYIGNVGNTGQSRGNHLHIEVRVTDSTGDPLAELTTPTQIYNKVRSLQAVDIDTFDNMPLTGAYDWREPRPTINDPALTVMYWKWLDPLLSKIRSIFNAAKTTSSPIILDLDKDGVETTALTSGTYFDHDANGFSEQTGWASSDDGLLVMDRDNDGTIDNGSELFGDNTLLADGTHAANGFQALAELDTNTDGKIDANDAAYSQLRVWQDYDEDGYTSEGELKTLSELGIQSINTGYTNSTTIDSNGNSHKQVSSFTWNDGTTNTATDVWFKQDKMFTIANDWVDVPEDIAALPDLQGFGNVYDLHQAMARERLAGSDTLKGLVEQFAAATDINTRNALIDQIIYRWTGVEGVDPNSRGTVLDARKIAALEKLFAATGPASLSLYYRPNEASYIDKSYNGVYELIYSQLMAQTQLKDLYSKITYTWDETTQSVRGDLTAVITDIQNLLTIDITAGKTLLAEFSRTLKGVGAQDMMNYETYYQTFALQGQDLGLIIQAAGMTLITGTAGNDTLTGSQLLANLINGNDGNDTLRGGLTDDIINGGEGSDIIYGYAGDDIIDGGIGNDTLYGEYGNDTYKFGIGSGQDTISDNDGGESSQIDTVEFGAGITLNDIEGKKEGTNLRINIKGTTDSLLIQNGYTGGQYRIEKFKFSDGTILNGISMNIQGTTGNDTLSGSAGDDTLDGGAGNDTLNGGIGNDTYKFVIGSGTDTISDYDTTSGNRDTVEFGEGITPTDLEFVKEGYHLKIKINGQTDTLLIQNWFNAATPANYRVEQFKFTDGTTLTIDDIEQAGYKIYGTTTSETLTGSNAKDIIDGGTGNDTLNGGDGNDILNGGAGNDILKGEAGDDILDGGDGNDTFYGGLGNDTYKFGIGSGSDTISDYATDYATTTDTVKFGEGITPTDLEFVKEGYHLKIKINGQTDTLTIQNWFYGTNPAPYRVEQFKFADGTTLTPADLDATGYKMYGTAANDSLSGSTAKDEVYAGAGNDSLYGYAGNDTINGEAGTDYLYGGDGNDTLNGGADNDTLNGEAGNDTLDGGAGSDTLNGGLGNDTYKFGIGSGSDTISDYSTDYATTTDKVEMGANSLNLILTKTSNNLTITNNTSTDQLTMQSWYSGAAYQTEMIQTADGKHLHNNQVAQLIQAMATFCTTNGVTWNQAIEQKPAEVQQVLAQYWSQT